jgi:hypothetical protein
MLGISRGQLEPAIITKIYAVACSPWFGALPSC